MRNHSLNHDAGPFRSDQIRSGDPYELSNGHAIRCMTTGARGSLATGAGYTALARDPAVEDIGIDTGFSPTDKDLRAPDLAIGKIADKPGWAKGAPVLAVEYADTGQDEVSLREKIIDLHAAGTKYIWVVRLSGPRRVEIHEPGQAMRTVLPGDTLSAPGALANPLPVEALYDRNVAQAVDFGNALRQFGYETLDEIRDEGKAEGKAEGEALGEARALRTSILEILTARGLEVDDAFRAELADCRDHETLKGWVRKAAVAASVDEIR